MAERHTGTNIASKIQEVLEIWNIRDSYVSAVVTDNASNMITAVDSLELSENCLEWWSKIVTYSKLT